jgi:hypothetical protein
MGFFFNPPSQTHSVLKHVVLIPLNINTPKYGLRYPD